MSNNLTYKQFLKTYKKAGSVRGVTRATGCTFHRAHCLYKQAVEAGELPEVDKKVAALSKPKQYTESQKHGTVREVANRKLPLPKRGEIKRYLLTTAQNNTHVHKGFLQNLEALADFYGAQIMVSRYIYMKRGLGAIGDKAHALKSRDLHESLEWDSRIEKYLVDDRVELAPGLLWCGELNISPTASNPLSGMAAYARGNSAIIPHTRIRREAIPTAKHLPTRQLFTTGCVTKRNYIIKKAGILAQFHHCYGASLVEVDHKGRWWVRQINAEDVGGGFYDLQLEVRRGSVEISEDSVKVITWGDIHAAQPSDQNYAAQWFAKGNALDVLQPEYQVAHDTFDHRARNHHDKNNFFVTYQKFVNNKDCVKSELELTAELLKKISRPWCTTVVVSSNHDRALNKWLNDSCFKEDPKNAEIYLETMLDGVRSIKAGVKDWDGWISWTTRWLDKHGIANRFRFLGVDESFSMAGVEMGQHGDLGVNGARGSIAGFSRMSSKYTIGHVHTAGIRDSVYAVGVSASSDMGYNKGPGSWSCTFCVQYKNGKRCLVDVIGGQWRAE